MAESLELRFLKARNAEKRGDRAEAIAIYQAILQQFPANARAKRDLATVQTVTGPASALPREELDRLTALYHAGRFEELIERGEPLMKRHPRTPALHNLLGVACLRLGRAGAAADHLRIVLTLDPGLVEAHVNLGVALKNLGRLADAVASYERALMIKPDHVAALNNLGVALDILGRHGEAVGSFERALQLQPDDLDTTVNLGRALGALGETERAIACFERALSVRPDHAGWLNNLGLALSALGRFQEATACYERALTVNPGLASAHNNLGGTLKTLGRDDAALACFQRAIAIDPDYANAHNNLGNVLASAGRRAEAITAYEHALLYQPGHSAARFHKLYQQAHMCDWDALAAEADFLHSAGVTGDPVSPHAMLALEDEPARNRIRSERFSASRYHHRPFPFPAAGSRADGAKLRVGYFSADFHNHATMYLMAGLFEQHDRDRFTIHAYSYGPERDDEMRRRLVGAVDVFHDVRTLDDRAVAELARREGIDIAVDLKGHTTDARLGIFALRAAPVQISYIGYPGTNGASFIDYIIADEVVIPADQRAHYSEKVIFLPGSYQVNDDSRRISEQMATRSGEGLPERGFVFCCFNRSYKITAAEFDIWMRLLAKIEGSVLWLLETNREAVGNLRKEASGRGIDAARLIFAGQAPQAEHLARLKLADLFLDTFACNAHTTASDALWAGLPVLTKAGRGFAARVAASVLDAAGLPDMVTETAEDYERLALELASHPERLANVATRLAENRRSCALFDTGRFARQIERVYAEVHQRHLSGLDPADIRVDAAAIERSGSA